jgi:hypothetical protein
MQTSSPDHLTAGGIKHSTIEGGPMANSFKTYIVVDEVDEHRDKIDRHMDELVAEHLDKDMALEAANRMERAHTALTAIFETMNGQEWNSDTTMEIAAILTGAGFKFNDTGE